MKIQEALDRLFEIGWKQGHAVALFRFGTIRGPVPPSDEDKKAAESAVLALYEGEKAIADGLAKALAAVWYSLPQDVRTEPMIEAALTAYQAAKDGKHE